MIEFSDYIAISVPELRFLGQKNYTEKLAHYIKNKKPEIDIHLLGCTELKLLKSLNFCTTSDSSSWTGCVRYGQIETTQGKLHYKHLKDEVVDEWTKKSKAIAEELGIKLPNYKRTGILSFSAEQLIKKYSMYAGSQD